MDLNELFNSMNKINQKVNSSILSSSLSLQFQELSRKNDLSLNAQTMAAFMPMSEILKSSQFSSFLQSQKKMMNSLSAFSSVSSVLQQIAVPKISDSAFVSLQGIAGLQNMQYIESLKLINNATSVSNFINSSLEIKKIGNLSAAFNTLTAQLTQLASDNNDWDLLDEYKSFVSDAVEFSDDIIENDEKQLEISFKFLFDRFTFYYEKHKQSGEIIFRFFEILMMLTSMHQYYDFIKTKPELATKNDIVQLRQAQQNTLNYVKKIASNNDKNIEERALINKCPVLLKPNKRSTVINELPKNYFIEVFKKQPTWVLIKYIDPKDGTPQMGWILNVNVKF